MSAWMPGTKFQKRTGWWPLARSDAATRAVGVADGALERGGVERRAVGDVRADQTPAVQVGAGAERVGEVFDGPGRRFRGERGEGHARAIVSGETVSRSRHLLPGRPGHNAPCGVSLTRTRAIVGPTLPAGPWP